MQEFHVCPPPRRKAAQNLTVRRPASRIAGLVLGLGVCLALGACGQGAESQRIDARTLAQASVILDDIALTELTLSPQTATQLGLEAEAGPTASARLDDHSQAGFERRRLVRIELLARVQQAPPLPADHPVARDIAVVRDALARLVEVQKIGHGEFSLAGVRPYSITPFDGAWIEGPQLLANDQRMQVPGDADAYLSRLRALADAVDDTSRRLLADAAAGVLPPAAMLGETERRVRALITPPDISAELRPETLPKAVSRVPVDTSGANSTPASPLAQLKQTYASQMLSLPELGSAERNTLIDAGETFIDTELADSYRRLADTLDDLSAKAPLQGGVWALPNGFETYTRLLAWLINEEVALDTLHDDNLADTEIRAAALQAALDAAGSPPGPLDVRIALLTEQLDLEARAAATLAAEAAARAAREAAREAFRAASAGLPAPPRPDTPLPPPPVAAAPPILASRTFAAPSLTGYTFIPARFDGGRPAQVTQNTERLAAWPRHMHDALRFDSQIYLRAPFASLLSARRHPARALMPYPGFQMAWKMYASEAFGTDLFDTPESRIGHLHWLLFEAALASADTGLHHKRWSIEQTIDYLTAQTGLPQPLMREAALEIAAQPAYASARLVGYRRLSALQARASAVLGPAYSETAFQSVLLTSGPRPFAMIEADVESWYEGQLPPAE